VTELDEILVLGWIAHVDVHPAVPLVGDWCQIGIEGGAQVADQIGKRVGEILVLALAEAVAGHDDMAAELAVVGIKRGDLATLFRRQQARMNGREFAGSAVPVDASDTIVCGERGFCA
jgi:hypothetical protein